MARARSRARLKPPAPPGAPSTRTCQAPTHLSLRVASEQARRLTDSANAIDYYNQFVAKHGLFGEEFRDF